MVGTLFFWIFACAAVMFALGVIVARNPMHSALSLVATLVSLAGIFLQLHAEFLAWILIIVYTGAVMVLIIFVISLLNLQKDDPIEFTAARRWGMAFVALFIMGVLVYLFRDPLVNFGSPERLPAGEEWGSVRLAATYLFTRYLLPFELISILLTAAVIGSIVIARRPPSKETETNE